MSAPDSNMSDRAKKAEKVLDEALQDTFPASDPLAFTPQLAGKDAHHLDEEPRSGLGVWWRSMLARMGPRRPQ